MCSTAAARKPVAVKTILDEEEAFRLIWVPDM
jgi:hypothetical protein